MASDLLVVKSQHFKLITENQMVVSFVRLNLSKRLSKKCHKCYLEVVSGLRGRSNQNIHISQITFLSNDQAPTDI